MISISIDDMALIYQRRMGIKCYTDMTLKIKKFPNECSTAFIQDITCCSVDSCVLIYEITQITEALNNYKGLYHLQNLNMAPKN